MPALNGVSSLESLSCSSLSLSLARACARLEASQEGEGEVEAVLDSLPVPLLEAATQQALELLTSQAGTRGTGPGGQFSRVRGGTAALLPGLPTALRLLPRPQTRALDLGTLFSGARLSRTMNSQCSSSLSLGLCRASRLTRLQLRSKCTDSLLATIGGSCTLLQELNISLSEQVTDSGLSSLLSCPSLSSLDLLKCWGVTPAGVTDLLLGLKYLRKLYFANMKSVLEVLLAREEQGPFLLELFDSSEYSLVVPGEGPLPESNPATWLSGPCSLADISPPFPQVTTLRLMLSDQEVAQLHSVPHLVHLEVEFSDDPGPGLTSLLSSHPNRAKFQHLFLQVGPIQASHLRAMASNCPSLAFFRLIGFQVEGASSLKPELKSFRQLKHLNISLYDDEADSSSEEDDEEDEAGPTSRHTREIVDFFLHPKHCLEVVTIHMNCGAFLTPSYLGELVERGVFLATCHLHLSSPRTIRLGLAAVHLLLARLPRLRSLKVTSWQLEHGEVQGLKEEARGQNKDITYI